MSRQPPKIDQRSYDDIVRQTTALAQTFTDWRPHPQGQADAGRALIRIFGRMAALVSDRLNQVPDKHFLAFLDLIGTQLQPPQPARVPLTFYLATGSTVDAFVPAYTRVASPPLEGEEDEVIFETDRELVVTPAQLQAVFVRQPEGDRYSDYTAQATGVIDDAFPAFTATQPIQHCCYLAADTLFTLLGPKTITLTFTLAATINVTVLNQQLTWAFWNGTDWQVIPVTSTLLGNQWIVAIANVVAPQPQTIDGITATWLRTQLTVPFSPNDTTVANALPSIQTITARVALDRTNLNPDVCFFNTAPLDLSKDFYPFGEQPRFNDTFYLGHREVLAIAGTTIKVSVTLSEAISPKKDGGIEIAWEAWDGLVWQLMQQATGKDKDNKLIANGAAEIFTNSGEISLKLPNQLALTTINGETNYWIRARIVKGNYGEAAKTTKTGNKDGYPIYELTEATLKPPSIKTLTLGYTYSVSSPLSACRTYNDFTYTNPLLTVQEVVSGVASSTETVQLLRLNHVNGLTVGDRLRIPEAGNKDYTIRELYPATHAVVLEQRLEPIPTAGTRVFRQFSLFSPMGDRKPTLYLGFDQAFSNRAITLYAQVAALTADKVTLSMRQQAPSNAPAQLVWEYSSPNGWALLGVEDETGAFAERGLLHFIGPADLQPRFEFGKSLCWLRVRWQDGNFKSYPAVPYLRRWLTNTTWASQAMTLTDEEIGSSDGNPNQTFRTSQAPVLLGQQLQVGEPQLPSPTEHVQIQALEGDDAITSVQDDAGQIERAWVRWHEVPDFYGSGSRDRHYRINHITGEIYFGDGQQGMVPPLGRNNIRLVSYRTGGGEQGDRPADSITQLKTTVPYIDRVTNLEAAGGGAAQESLDQVKDRGPKRLRHRERAVTAQDFEDLAFEASPDVARARAVLPVFDPLDSNPSTSLWLEPGGQAKASHTKVQSGVVKLLIVPRSRDRQPVPSLVLIDRVEAFIQTHCVPTIGFQVAGPDWVGVSITAHIIPTTMEIGEAVRTLVLQQLDRFLHPLTGGSKGRGWDFARQPHESDFYALIESLDGVDRVRSLQVTIERIPDITASSQFLIFSGTHTISIVSAQGGQ